MLLRIRSLSKTYPNGVETLKEITLTIPRGMYGLLGPNGAGKSTLMRAIATLREPDAGSIRLGDVDLEAGDNLAEVTVAAGSHGGAAENSSPIGGASAAGGKGGANK